MCLGAGLAAGCVRAPRKGRQASANPSRRVEPAGGEEAHLETALVDRRQPARDADGEQDVVVDRDAVEAHAAELQAGEEVGAGAARRRAELLGLAAAAGEQATLDAAETTMWMAADEQY